MTGQALITVSYILYILTEASNLYKYYVLLLSLLQPADVILADRGFCIEEIVALYYAEVKISTFTRGKKQLAVKDVESKRKIASVWIHAERVN